MADEPTRFTPTVLISVFGLSLVSALIYAGTTMQRINQLEANDGAYQKQMTDLAASFDRRMASMAESRYAKQAEFEAKIAHLDRTDAARTEELKGIHSQLDENAGQYRAAGMAIMGKLEDLERALAAMRYGDMRQPPR